MAEIVWTEPALNELDEIADYIALDDPHAAQALIQRIFDHVAQLADHPQSGAKPPELKGWRYRQIVEPPCRVFYRVDGSKVIVLYVMRSERRLRRSRLTGRNKPV